MSARVISKSPICRCFCRSDAQHALRKRTVPGDDQWLEQDMEEARAYGLSERFVSIMKHLRAAKVPYVRFDADGGDVEGLDAA